MGSVCREVVTVQLGHYANFVGTHWWNLQDASFCYDLELKNQCNEIRNDVLFREGLTQTGQQTYTPRLILMDVKGSLNTLKQDGCLYDDGKQDTALTWKGTVATHREEPVVKNPFLKDLDHRELYGDGDFQMQTLRDGNTGIPQVHVDNGLLELPRKVYRLETSVRVWSDFLRVHLHPRTISLIQQYNHDGETSRLEAFGQGRSLFKEPAFLDELEDRLHFYVEECDYLQGFQVLCDLQDGFSGVSSKVVEHLHDEYGRKGIFTWGLTPTLQPKRSVAKEVYRLINTVLGIVQLSSQSSLFCPLSLNSNLGRQTLPPTSFPHVNYDASLNYHTSALLATALESMTLPYRLHSASVTMSQLAEALTFSGRKVVTSWASVPFPMKDGDSLPDALCSYQAMAPWKPLSPCGGLKESRCFAQSVVLRGAEKQRHVSNLPPGTQPASILHTCTTEEVLGTFLHTLYPTALSDVQLVGSPCKVTAPYPQFFTPSVSRQGYLLDEPRPNETGKEQLVVAKADFWKAFSFCWGSMASSHIFWWPNPTHCHLASWAAPSRWHQPG
uniref:Protein misato homolog 1 n=1 Tax=Latimeria chalumnae TaxID=7897 RepID=H3A2P6_LATCH|nr:PREDICTED: protein misato homolog 1 [Latimeria chalumnae]|eukprot:XP_006001695.1 PREDICTED: protein misato homolog 1 [Latimeria chalumnae]